MDELTKEILLAAVIFFTVIANVLLVMTRRKVGRVSRDAEKAKKGYAKQFEEMATAYRDLSTAHQDEITRLRDQAEADRKTHKAQLTQFEAVITTLTEKVGRLEFEKEAQRQQIEVMENAHREDAKRWVIERRDMTERIDTQGAQIKTLEDVKRRADKLEQERATLLDRILALEAARKDENAPVIAGETISE